ncbi:uncharacterized protein LOC119190076 [Manduca sexta]|uniref:uncharacterized protein LOC119190076 n=1 Tax=Manduca sexta TaxID=7130 RepID=UPI00188ECC76|nr:uncharacterized protein LOC119190076 [Manduca sexta]
MSIFDRLPTVKKCCFCLNLKCGTICVAVCGMFQLFCSILLTVHNRSRNCESQFEKIIHIVAIVLVILDVVLCILSIGLIIGIIKKMPQTATLWMYSVCLSIIGMLVMASLLLIAGFSRKQCLILITDSISTFVTCLIWIYFLLVVRSYYPSMVQ